MLLRTNRGGYPMLAMQGEFKILVRAKPGGWPRLVVRGDYEMLLRANQSVQLILTMREGFFEYLIRTDNRANQQIYKNFIIFIDIEINSIYIK